MKRCFILVVTFLLAGVATSSAQKVQDMFGTDQKGKVAYGFRAGFNLSNLAGEFGRSTDEKLNLDPRIGFHVGTMFDIPITNGFYIQPEILFTTRGAKGNYWYEDGSTTVENTETCRAMYIQIPLLASFRADLTSSVNLQLHAGPYFSFGVGGTVSAEAKVQGGTVIVEYPYFGKSTMTEDHLGIKRFDMGLSCGVGVTVKQHYYIGLQYDLGLMNGAIQEEWGGDTKIYNRCFSIQVGYHF